MNIAPNIDNNPLKAKPQAAAKRPVLPIHAGKCKLKVATTDVYGHRPLPDAADDALLHHLQQAASDKDSRRLMKRSMAMVLPTK